MHLWHTVTTESGETTTVAAQLTTTINQQTSAADSDTSTAATDITTVTDSQTQIGKSTLLHICMEVTKIVLNNTDLHHSCEEGRASR